MTSSPASGSSCGPWMTRSASARSSTPPSRTGRPGRSPKPTPPPGAVTGQRSPRSSCGTTCSTAPRRGNCCPWPARWTSAGVCLGPAGRRTAHRQVPQRPHRPDHRGRTPLHRCRQRRHRPADVVAISREIGCSPAQVAISWVRQQPGPVIPLIAARTEEQFRDNLAATGVHLSPAAPGPPRRTQPSHPRVPRGRHAGGLRRRRGLRHPAARHRRPPRAGRAPHHHRHPNGQSGGRRRPSYLSADQPRFDVTDGLVGGL